MSKMILDEQQVHEIIQENRYRVNQKNKFISRCIDGRYQNDDNLPPLAIPGADAGQLALILATANIYGLEVNREKAYESLIEVIGGEKNLRFHTDCGYIKQTDLDPEGFNLTQEDVDFIKEKLEKAKEKGAQEVVLEGEHLEGGVIIARGYWSLKTKYFFEMSEGKVLSQIFVFHQTLVNERHRSLVKKLLDKKAISALKDDDDDYLYTILSETSEAHLFETLKRISEGLPIFEISFEEDGNFNLKHLGNV